MGAFLTKQSTSNRCVAPNWFGEYNQAKSGERPRSAWQRETLAHDSYRGPLREMASLQTLDHVKVGQVSYIAIRVNLPVRSQKHIVVDAAVV